MTIENRNQALDGLRGVAILLVLLYHFTKPLFHFFSFGWAGVDLFFVLSGFLITGILIGTKHKKKFIQIFFIRRALRILPLYYGVIIMFAFIAPHFGPTIWWSQYQFFFWTHTENYLFLLHGFKLPLGHFWSLAIEEQFYLMWPFIVLVTNNKQLLIVSLMLIITSITFRAIDHNPMLIYGQPLAHLDGLAMGSVIAILLRIKKELLFRYANTIFFISTILLISYALAITFGKSTPFSFTIISSFFSSILILALQSTIVKKVLSNKTLLFFGKYSYGMYVFNSIIFHFSNWAGADRLDENHKLIVYIGDFLLTIIVSYLSYHLFEIHFLRLKQKVAALK